MWSAFSGRRKAAALVAAGLAVAGAAAWTLTLAGPDPRRPWLALLAAFCFFTPIAAGMVTWPAIIRLANGGWIGGMQNPPAAAVRFAPVSLVVLIVLWLGAGRWAPWAQAATPQGMWLHPAFVFLRDLAGLAAFWGAALVWRRRGGPGPAALLVILYGSVFSLLGNDLVMALDPRWSSSAFGAYFFISGLFGAAAAWSLVAALDPATPPARLHDLGKLTFSFCLITTYLMYCHLLPIWYENIPRETRFVIPRMNFSPWRDVSISLLGLVYLGPIAGLLSARVKRDRRLLGPAAVVILLGLMLERLWLIQPVFSPRQVLLSAGEIGAAAALLGLLSLALLFRPSPDEARP